MSALTRSSVAGLRDDGLQRQPLVDDQRIVGVSGVEIVERRARSRNIAQREGRERGHAVGHVVGGLVLRAASVIASAAFRRDQEVERDIAERAPSGAGGVGAVRAGVGKLRDSVR